MERPKSTNPILWLGQKEFTLRNIYNPDLASVYGLVGLSVIIFWLSINLIHDVQCTCTTPIQNPIRYWLTSQVNLINHYITSIAINNRIHHVSITKYNKSWIEIRWWLVMMIIARNRKMTYSIFKPRQQQLQMFHFRTFSSSLSPLNRWAPFPTNTPQTETVSVLPRFYSRQTRSVTPCDAFFLSWLSAATTG